MIHAVSISAPRFDYKLKVASAIGASDSFNRMQFQREAEDARNKLAQLVLLMDGDYATNDAVAHGFLDQLLALSGYSDTFHQHPRLLELTFGNELVLVRLAATACGLTTWTEESETHGLFVNGAWWNPLKDNTAMLDMAVLRGIALHPGQSPKDWPRARSLTAEATEPPDSDRTAALRLAAVKVAIGSLFAKTRPR